ncbi:MAG: hypothetical protein ABIN79_11090 [Marmoricola sp.]
MREDQRGKRSRRKHPRLTPEEDEQQRGGGPEHPSDQLPPRREKPDPEAVDRVRDWMHRHDPPSRQDGFWPYLLIRAFPGDTGVRQPPVGFFWESPDIRVYEGDVSDPASATPTLHPRVGVPHTVFVHVWNLGRLAALGTTVRVWWANPSFSFGPSSPEPPHLIGVSTVNLDDRSSPGCHQLVRIPTPWVPVDENAGHECLLAVATHVMDPGGAGFEASTDRHVGQRNVTLAAPSTDLRPLLNLLGSALSVGSDLALLHGGDQVIPILLAHKANLGVGVRKPTLLDIVHEVPGGNGIGHLGTVIRTVGGRVVADGHRSVTAMAGGENLAHFDRSTLLGDGVGRLQRTKHDISPARAVVQALGVRDLRAGSIAAAISSSSGAGNLLRFQEQRDGNVIGGYSVIVRE